MRRFGYREIKQSGVKDGFSYFNTALLRVVQRDDECLVRVLLEHEDREIRSNVLEQLSHHIRSPFSNVQ